MQIPLVDLKAQYGSIRPQMEATIQRVLENTNFILGSEVSQFEQAFASYIGAKATVGVASGTAALHLALLACGIGPGDEVVTTAHTFVATAEAISYTVTQALLNIYNHAGANFATVRTVCTNSALEVYIIDDGRGFDVHTISSEKTSLFKAELKAREAGGTLTIKSIPRPQADHGTTIILYVPLPRNGNTFIPGPPSDSRVQRAGSRK